MIWSWSCLQWYFYIVTLITIDYVGKTKYWGTQMLRTEFARQESYWTEPVLCQATKVDGSKYELKLRREQMCKQRNLPLTNTRDYWRTLNQLMWSLEKVSKRLDVAVTNYILTCCYSFTLTHYFYPLRSFTKLFIFTVN